MQTSKQSPSAIQFTVNEAADRTLATIKALAPTIAAPAVEAEAAARIPADVLQMLKSVGVLRMTAPKKNRSERKHGYQANFGKIANAPRSLLATHGNNYALAEHGSIREVV
jgi:hypothetical protein